MMFRFQALTMTSTFWSRRSPWTMVMFIAIRPPRLLVRILTPSSNRLNVYLDQVLVKPWQDIPD